MNLEDYRNYCLQFPGVEEGFPFDTKTLVFKVAGKMFALCDVDDFQGVNLKCNPERSLRLREEYTSIRPGFHMNKQHWNTVGLYGDVDDRLLLELTDHSYDLIRASLPKKKQLELPNR